ncbi:MAG: 4Fe-4S dicluster domain-containing protein [Pyrinomonadaceae bacterium]
MKTRADEYLKNLPENLLNRRDFLRLMGASIALAGFAGCNLRQPVEQIVPYVREPEEITLGKPLFYATAMTLGGYAQGLLVESHEFRPTKVEGNPLHPASLGATDVFAQASVLSLYDPDRSKDVTRNGQISTYNNFLADLRRNLNNQRTKGGAGLRILTQTISSPTLFFQINSLLKDFPNAVWHQYEPLSRDNEREGAILAFGEDAATIYKFDAANVILSLDADFLTESPARVRYARDFSKRRRVRAGGNTQMNRLYAVECTPTITGSMADNRLALKSSEIENFARNLTGVLTNNSNAQNSPTDAKTQNFINALAKDLNANRGNSIVIAGTSQPPIVHAMAHALNEQLGNAGKTVFYTEPVAANPSNNLESLRGLVTDINNNKVEMLAIIGGNPAYDAPSDFFFAESLNKVAWKTHLSLYENETSARCDWHIPAAHELESWSDARAFDGTVSIIQPLIAPLYNGKSAHEFLAAFTSSPDVSDYEIVRGFWRGKFGGQTVVEPPTETPQATQKQTITTQNTNAATQAAQNTNATNNSVGNVNAANNPPRTPNAFEQMWQQSLRDGVIANTAFPQKNVRLKTDRLNSTNSQSAIQNSKSIELIFKADPSVYDGRFANNGWLQELPKPLTKLTWDNAVLMNAATARKFNLNQEIAGTGGSHGQIIVDVVELKFGGKTVRAPAFILEGHADDAVTVYLGYGRTRAGKVGSGAGFNAYAVRNSGAMWFGSNLEIAKTGDTFSLACTQNHHSMEGRELVRHATIEKYKQNPDFAKREADNPDKQISLYPGWKYEGHAWGMSIDTSICTGCNACVIACQAENNIPVVGKEEVLRAREMHWIRVDTYYETEGENINALHQPVPCQQCENAPCEVVCPPGATTHSTEGLNEMTYNRCVGTRYCSNNCPYKVRRFNFFGYSDFETPVVQLQRNPQVTTRSRGVMEKCTYCVQRIQYAKINAETEGRALQDGEITTACQQACPTEAIIFGDINDKNSRVAKLKDEPTNYAMLAELNTRPRTTYLATVKNPNEEMSEPPARAGG